MAWTGSFFQTAPPFFVTAARREEIGGMIARLPAQARQLDAYKALYAQHSARMNGPQRDTVATNLAIAEAQFTTANNYARAAYRVGIETPNGLPPHQRVQLEGLAGFASVALGISAVVAVALVVFLGATLGPFAIAVGLLTAALLAIGAVLSTMPDIQDRLPDIGGPAAAGLGLVGLVVVGFVAWSLLKRGRT